MKDLLGLRLFTRVARLGSISAAARDCGLSQSQASRIIAELEARLGVLLLSRTTRAVVPTEAGAEYLVRVEAILDALEEAQNSVREGGEQRGIVRISMPSSLSYREVIPRLPAFAALHPALDIQVVLVDQRQVSRAAGQPAGDGWNLVVLQHTNCGIVGCYHEAPDLLATYMGVPADSLEPLAITDPYKAVAIDVAALKANPRIRSGFTVTGLVYDVATGKIDTVVPPSLLQPGEA